MTNLSMAYDDLAFLKDIVSDRNEQYQTTSWLQSLFEEDIWSCHFNKTLLSIDFRVELENGSLLTSVQNRTLLTTFKSWLCIQTHSDVTGGQIVDDMTAYHAICRTLNLIDYFLLNASHFELSKHGLQILTENDMKSLLLELASSNRSTYSIYRWKEKLALFLRERSKEITNDEYNRILSDRPELASIDVDPVDRQLDLSDEEIIRARVYLWSKELYKQCQGLNWNYKFSPNTEQLASIIYMNTLSGKASKPIPEELCISPAEPYKREFRAAPVRTSEGNQLNDKLMASYSRILRSMGLLADVGLPIPFQAINALDQRSLQEALNLKTTGRFATLPQAIVFSSLKNSIEFVLKYGDDLVDSYLSLISQVSKLGMKNCDAYTLRHDIRQTLKPSIIKLGVRRWHLSHYMSMTDYNPGSYLLNNKTSSEYFCRFRQNEGLFELIEVLYGAVQICVGTLMARRQRELFDLISGNCLDKSKRYLVFYNRKSGTNGKRQIITRPIPTIAVKMILLLERLQTGLIAADILNAPTNLFARPDKSGTYLTRSIASFNASLDSFCDYFQTPLNIDGQRYYIRQHQLRRFFAMLFFWGRSFGGMETLRWFLGHVDVEHLYHYITESTPGEVLKSVKALYAVDQVKDKAKGSEALADLMEEHFGTRQFSVLDSSELEEYIEFLLSEGKVQIYPEFFQTADGKRHKIMITVKGIDNESR